MRILMVVNSPNFLRMKGFYEKIGVNWVQHKSSFYIHSINNFSLALSSLDSENLSRELFFIPERGKILSYFGRNLPDIDIKEITVEKNPLKTIIPILRSRDIEKLAKETYSSLGDWKLEKHERGPEHYCLSEAGKAMIEIYPVRKKNPIEDIELVFSGYSIYSLEEDRGVIGMTDPDGQNVTCID